MHYDIPTRRSMLFIAYTLCMMCVYAVQLQNYITI